MREQAALAAATIFFSYAMDDSLKQVACYIALVSELDLGPIMQGLWKKNQACFLPRVAYPEKELHFIAYQENDPLEKNAYAILEPMKQVGKMILPQDLDIILLPLRGFDRKGTRLGTGGGYYDRTLAGLKNSLSKKPALIGVGFACQEFTELPRDAWDVPLDAVLTEKELIVF